jgi:hypothetical protein
MFLGQPQIQKKKKGRGNKEKKKAEGNKQGPRFTTQKLGNPRSTGTLQLFNFSLTTEAVRPEGETPQQLSEEWGMEVVLELIGKQEEVAVPQALEEETALQTDEQSYHHKSNQWLTGNMKFIHRQGIPTKQRSNDAKSPVCLKCKWLLVVNSKEYNTKVPKKFGWVISGPEPKLSCIVTALIFKICGKNLGRALCSIGILPI